MFTPRKTWSVIAALAATAMLLVGCGSSSSSTSGAAGSGTAAAASSNSNLKGAPVTVGVVEEQTGPAAQAQFQEWGQAAQAAAGYVNNTLGGFGGRPVKVVICDSQSTAAGALTCANQLVADKVDFVTGLSLNFGADGVPVLEKAHIPVQTAPISAQEFSSPDSFPFGGGSLSEFPAEAVYATQKLGVKSASMLIEQLPTAAIVYHEMQPVFSKAGGSLTQATYPATSADLAPAVTKAVAGKPQMVFAFAANVQSAEIYPMLEQQGIPAKAIMQQGGAVDVDNFFSKLSPSVLNGTVYSYEFDSFDNTSNAEVAAFRKAMEQYEHVPGRGEYYQWAFSTVLTDYAAAKAMGFRTFDGQTLASYLTTHSMPVYMAYKYDRSQAGKSAPAVGDPWVRFVRYRNGQLVDQAGGWVNGVTGKIIPFSAAS